MTGGAEDQPHLRRLFDDKLFPLAGDMIVGRHVNCDLVLENEKGASRKHARLSVIDGQVFITDLGSLNGTLVNGHEIEERYQLNNADVLVFDEQEYELLLPHQPIDEFDENMTVIANKAEIGNPHLIKPAIRMVDEDELNNTVDAIQSTNDLAPAEPTPQERIPSEPTPSEPTPQERIPSEPTPSELTPNTTSTDTISTDAT